MGSRSIQFHIESLMRAIDLLNKPAAPVIHSLRLRHAENMGRLVREQMEREGVNA